MSKDQQITIQIDGVSYPAPRGAMLIEVADAHGVEIPRFCYHKKLSVAANCRMCLVELERAPKPLPACATPVQDGMKVHTRSPLALAAQQGMMEFLLINHPLDCPICDQGGECELQDVAMGFGRDVSQYVEAKRVVPDPDIGPLVATDMTRCIHCTRCVRFGDEIAGLRELGATGRGEFMRIGTYVAHTLESELSGNIIDLCPVGALTAKPSRFSGRAWEMIQHAGVATHDCVGSNVYAHTLNGKIVRVVPRDNEAINETWIADRDRFSYEGLYADDRLRTPKIKVRGRWEDADWESAMAKVAEGLRDQAPDNVGALISPSATLEEAYLLQKALRGIGVLSIDHRLQQLDFSAAACDPLFPWLGQPVAALEENDAVLLIGANPRKDQPMLGHRLRKAALDGARIMDVNPRAFEFTHAMAERQIVAPQAMGEALADLLAAVCAEQKVAAPAWLGKREPAVGAVRMAKNLCSAKQASVLLGGLAINHPDASALRVLASEIATRSGAQLGSLSLGGNAAGAWIAGAVPHRGPAGQSLAEAGYDAQAMLANPRAAYVLYGVEPEYDCAVPARALEALRQANFVVAFSAYANSSAMDYADVLLPIGLSAETSGTVINAEGRWQSFRGMTLPPDEARPGWKVLRVLGNLLDLRGFDYMSSEEVRDELKAALKPDMTFSNHIDAGGDFTLRWQHAGAPLMRSGGLGLYAIDAQVRRAEALQRTPDAQRQVGIALNATERERLGLADAAQAQVSQGDWVAVLNLQTDDALPDGVAWIPAGVAGTEALGATCGPVTLTAVGGAA
ncbi:NADH-quinone oxidoreductase subunit NuoG [Acidihalobacter ferrooxydans]|uniref:NADH-quinone oxidoreductase n=1 Tax=Acidihalobacter ferrooxydans TaxID=1765967 RepID=A0A1P8UJ41_9GAMM|nr:NADH-quinone oxidoreductase subunit NuoG [Acidihalobacter ferrooxydans]APZ43859.1 NADH-quinone oxidoreductase subunit G [Acidihalobacter ferrooxydans]